MKIADTSGQDAQIAKPPPNRKYISFAVVAILLVAAVVLVAPAVSRWSGSDASVAIDRIRTAQVVRGDFVSDLSIQGRVVAAVSPRLYSTAQGTITFHVAAGDSVALDQVLATINSPEMTNQLKQEQANLQRLQMELDRQVIQTKKQILENKKTVDLAKVALTAADREKRRADKAYASNSISQIDFEKAQDDLENAQLLYKHAVSDAELDEESLSFEVSTRQLQVDGQQLLVQELARKVDELILRSPVAGIVGNLAVEQKNQVTQNQAILSVVDLSEFELEVLIPESYADNLAIGMDADITFNGETHRAKLVTISPEIENNQVTGRVRFADQIPLGLRQNQRLTTRVLLENKPNSLMVQRGQFLESSGGRFAYVVKDGMAHRTAIETGARSLGNVEIVAGLNVGDTIIISGTDSFNDAQTLLITN